MQLATRKHSDLQGVPLITELPLSPFDQQVLVLILVHQTLACPFAAPPGTPEDRVEALRQALDPAIRDPLLLADASQLGLSLSPTTGVEMEAIIRRLYAAPAEVVARARKLIGIDDTPGLMNR